MDGWWLATTLVNCVEYTILREIDKKKTMSSRFLQHDLLPRKLWPQIKDNGKSTAPSVAALSHMRKCQLLTKATSFSPRFSHVCYACAGCTWCANLWVLPAVNRRMSRTHGCVRFCKPEALFLFNDIMNTTTKGVASMSFLMHPSETQLCQ